MVSAVGVGDDIIFSYWAGPRENGATDLVADEAQGKAYMGR